MSTVDLITLICVSLMGFVMVVHLSISVKKVKNELNLKLAWQWINNKLSKLHKQNEGITVWTDGDCLEPYNPSVNPSINGSTINSLTGPEHIPHLSASSNYLRGTPTPYLYSFYTAISTGGQDRITSEEERPTIDFTRSSENQVQVSLHTDMGDVRNPELRIDAPTLYGSPAVRIAGVSLKDRNGEQLGYVKDLTRATVVSENEGEVPHLLDVSLVVRLDTEELTKICKRGSTSEETEIEAPIIRLPTLRRVTLEREAIEEGAE